MQESYNWAVNGLKLKQAYDDLASVGAEITEEAVKAQYVKRGGLLLEDSKRAPSQVNQQTLEPAKSFVKSKTKAKPKKTDE